MATEDDGPESLTLRMLRAMDAKLDHLIVDMIEVKERLGLLEAQYASVSRRMDRLSGDVERLNKRLGIIEA